MILANLRHPNLPRVIDHFVIEGEGQYLVMDYIAGVDLRQRMDRIGTLSEEDVIIIGAAICDALTYLDARDQPIILLPTPTQSPPPMEGGTGQFDLPPIAVAAPSPPRNFL